MDTPEYLSTPPWTIVGLIDRGSDDESEEVLTHAKRTVEFAELYLHAGASGLPCAELARALAEAVLGLPEVELARKVLETGECAHAAATELAGLIRAAGEALPDKLEKCREIISIPWEKRPYSTPTGRMVSF